MTRRSIALAVAGVCLAAAVVALEEEKPKWSFDLGGQYRLRVEHFEEPTVGLTSLASFTSVANRLLAHARVDRGRFGLFGQIGVFREDGREPRARPTDEGDPDFQQLYVDLRLGSGLDVTARIGRQELSFGAARLVSARDSPNIRRSFDAVRMTLPWSRLHLETFVGRPVELLDGAFDDESDGASSFWGLYATRPHGEGGGLNVYYLGLDREAAVFDQGTAAEHRHTVGMRWFAQQKPWRWDADTALQFGEFGDKSIRAWFLGGEVARTIGDHPWEPNIALRSHVFSGDDDPLDGELNTFNPLFPKTTFFTEAGLFAPANAMDLHPRFSFSPLEAVTVTTSVDIFWRHSTRDALYRPPLVPRISGSDNAERFLGTIWEVLVKWSPAPDISVTLAYDFADARGFVERAGGKDPHFLMASFQARF